MAKPNGFVFYRGPSMIDGKPIVAILTGLNSKSSNSKTGGGLYQTWIMREDVHPLDAIQSGDDVSICGDCKHRGHIENGKNKDRTCYVSVFQAPSNIWKSYHRGIYPHYDPRVVGNALVRGGIIRSGSYGDPAAVPFYVWDCLMVGVDPGTGYTHQWARFPELAAFCMASVDDENERAQAKLLGFRTFRVRGVADPIGEYEVTCPASKEAGYKTTCDACRACGGTRAKARADIVIAVHGGKGKENAYERNAS